MHYLGTWATGWKDRVTCLLKWWHRPDERSHTWWLVLLTGFWWGSLHFFMSLFFMSPTSMDMSKKKSNIFDILYVIAKDIQLLIAYLMLTLLFSTFILLFTYILQGKIFPWTVLCGTLICKCIVYTFMNVYCRWIKDDNLV